MDCEEAERRRIDAFELWCWRVLEKTLESPLDCKEIQPVHSEGDQPWDFFGRKVMTNLDSIFKSRDITLPTKVHLVRTMVFPVVMYGCESWTVKKLSAEELMLLNCGVGEDS